MSEWDLFDTTSRALRFRKTLLQSSPDDLVKGSSTWNRLTFLLHCSWTIRFARSVQFHLFLSPPTRLKLNHTFILQFQKRQWYDVPCVSLHIQYRETTLLLQLFIEFVVFFHFLVLFECCVAAVTTSCGTRCKITHKKSVSKLKERKRADGRRRRFDLSIQIPYWADDHTAKYYLLRPIQEIFKQQSIRSSTKGLKVRFERAQDVSRRRGR